VNSFYPHFSSKSQQGVDKIQGKIYFKKVKSKISLIIFILFLFCLVFTSQGDSPSKDHFLAKTTAIGPQEKPPEKEKQDYIEKMMLRDTDPWGLKELTLKKLLKQSSIKWAIRAGKRHILD